MWSERQGGQLAAFYSTKVRITVRAGGEMVMREGIGTGFARAAFAEAAHEMALKAAETDATKRALATFGNPFGLALYDKEQAGVTRPPVPAPFILSSPEGKEVSFATQGAFSDAAFVAIRDLTNIDDLYTFWERNRRTLVQIKNSGESRANGVIVDALIAALKAKARSLGQPTTNTILEARQSETGGQKEALAFPKEKRLRSKEHLKFVAQLACLVCGRMPSHAHHVRYAQIRALGLKVSDEFTVPLCSVHHDEIHRTGDERGWWARREIEPLKVAAELWASTHARTATMGEAGDQTKRGANGLEGEQATGE